MKKALKELIENAPKKTVGTFDALMIISNGVYDGFYGKNGYNNILILGRVRVNEESTWYKVSEYGDKLDILSREITHCPFNLDIPTKYGVPVIWFDYPIYIDNSLEISSVLGEIRKKENK